MIFETGARLVAFGEFRKSKGPLSYLAAVRDSKDPTVFTVLFEDGAALLGLVVAFVGIFLAQQLDMPELDGMASVLIGVILASTAALLAYESKRLLIGESASPALVAGISRIVSREAGVVRVNELLTMHLGPDDVT